ncbi:methionine biosynthesis protein MetW [Arenicellales bacterium nBUS_48]
MPRAAQFFPEEEDLDSVHGIDLKVYQCRDCGLVQLCQEPVPYHKEVITAATLSGSARQFRLQEMLAFVNNYSLSGKSILEVGAGKVEMLEVIEEAGAVATGLEASEASVSERIAAGRNLVMGYVGDQELGLSHDYSGFVSFNYLEHVPDPLLSSGLLDRGAYALT